MSLIITQAYTSTRRILIQVLPFPNAYVAENIGKPEIINNVIQIKCLQIWHTHWEQEVPE